MNVPLSFGRSALDRIAGPRAAATLHAAPPAAEVAQAGETVASTCVTLGAAGSGVAYEMPRAVNVAPSRFWAAAHGDALGALMLRNSGPYDVTLTDRWRGLGGALLRQLAATGEGSAQTLAEVTPPPDDAVAVEGAAAPGPVIDAAEFQAQALSGVTTDAVKASLTLTTRSGQSVSLEIAVNDGEYGGTRGLKVQVASSGPLSDAERDALAAMAGGLDQALEGLGQAVPRFDLSGLKGFDGSGELTGLDLAIEDPNASTRTGAMRALSLHLGNDRTALSLERTGSEMALSIAATATDVVDGDRRRSAIDLMLAQIDAAAERGHADPRTVGIFKDAFRQLQAPAPDASPVPADGDLPSQVQALQSGLADFEASFSGRSEKTNRFGGLTEQGTIDYRIGQNTSSTPADASGQSVTQVQTEASDATIQKTRTLLLDVPSGNYDVTNIRDRKTVTTLIDTSLTAITRALRKTDEHRLSAFTSLERDRVTAHHESPLDRSFIERLR